ncbi:MAG: MerR family transcriptional regulator [Acidobacteriota bacterium]
MSTSLTIGELAGLVGAPASTLRYYERLELLRPAGRTASNYRLYSTRELERVRFIRAAQSAGFTLADIGALLDFRDGVQVPCREVQSLIKARLSDVARRMQQFRHVRQVLSSFLNACQAAGETEPCQVMEKLSLAARQPGPSGTADRRPRTQQEE